MESKIPILHTLPYCNKKLIILNDLVRLSMIFDILCLPSIIFPPKFRWRRGWCITAAFDCRFLRRVALGFLLRLLRCLLGVRGCSVLRMRSSVFGRLSVSKVSWELQ